MLFERNNSQPDCPSIATGVSPIASINSEIGNPKSKIRNAFSLVELLVVIGLIVIIMALALPAFNFITGSRSVDGAANVISAFLGSARAESLTSQRTTGVLFYIDPISQRRAMAMVQATDPRSADSNANRAFVDVWLDLVDAEPTLLPAGVEVQTINDGSKGRFSFDRYIGFNRAAWAIGDAALANPNEKTDITTPYGGVILFDSNGRLTSQRYGFRFRTDARASDGTSYTRATRLAARLVQGLKYRETEVTPSGEMTLVLDCVPQIDDAANHVPLRSAMGVVLMDADQLKQNAFPAGSDLNTDVQIQPPNLLSDYGSAVAPLDGTEAKEEAWIDENATPLLVNRYNGTLVKGQ